jgi:hypothetical protein
MRKIIDTANIFAAIVFGSYLVALKIWSEALLTFQAEKLAGFMGWILLLLGAALVVGNFMEAYRDYAESESQRLLEVTTEQGVNAISIHALELQLLDVLNRAGDVSAPKVSLVSREDGAQIVCSLSFDLKKQDDVMKRADELKKLAREKFLKLIPSGVGIEIRANVTDLIDGTLAASGVSRQSDEFSGPVYPVTEEETDEPRI